MIPIIIPTWNNERTLIECLNSLAESNIPVRYIIVDNGSDKPFENETLSLKDKVIRLHANTGFTNAVNEGIKEFLENDALCDYCIVLNDDTEVFPDCIAKLVDAAERDEKIGIVASCPVKSRLQPIERSGSVMADLIGGHTFVSAHPGEVMYSTFAVQFHGVLLSRKLIQTIGLLDSNLINFCSDGDYCLRAKVADFQVCYHNTALLIHKEHKTVERLKDTHLQRDQEYFFYKWLGGLQNDLFDRIPLLVNEFRETELKAQIGLGLEGKESIVKKFKKQYGLEK